LPRVEFALNATAVPYQVPAEPGRWRALVLAALVHIALVVFLWFGVSWQNTVPVAIEAEIWSPQAREAAPKPEPLPVPAPAPEPPKPEPPKPVPIKPAPPPEPAAKTPDPDIALEKKRKQELEKKLAEELEKKRQIEEKEKKRLAEEQEKKRIAEENEKKRLADLDKKKADDKRKQELANKASEEMRNRQEEAADTQLEKIRRDKELKRLQAMAGETGAGDAERSSGPKFDANYLSKLASRIKRNTRFVASDAVPGNPTIEYELELLPDGSVKDIKILRESGYPAFDEAVKRAVYSTAPFERDPATGKIPTSITVRQRLKEN
jgi:colicin import membrane protein